jgi:hypothetical protein
MKELMTTFAGKGETKGFLFTQVQSTEKGYVYEVKTGASTHYEVFQKRINKQFDCISYPKSNSFGVWAWCYKTLEGATDKLNQL